MVEKMNPTWKTDHHQTGKRLHNAINGGGAAKNGRQEIISSSDLSPDQTDLRI